MDRLTRDLGPDELARCITYVDEAAQTTGNKNKWKDWNLVIRKCSKGRWGLARLECTVMPLMVSATETAEELSAAAVTRGIENPARKTSAVSLRISPPDFLGMLAGLALLVLSFVVQ